MFRSGSPRDPRRFIATFATALMSALAVLAAVAYLVAPAKVALAVEVAVASSVRVPANRVLIYGSASDSRRRPLANIRISVRKPRQTTVTLVSGRDGTFRKMTALKAGRYVLTVSRRSSGKTRTARATITFARGRAYRITVRLVRTGGLTMLPIRAY